MQSSQQYSPSRLATSKQPEESKQIDEDKIEIEDEVQQQDESNIINNDKHDDSEEEEGESHDLIQDYYEDIDPTKTAKKLEEMKL